MPRYNAAGSKPQEDNADDRKEGILEQLGVHQISAKAVSLTNRYGKRL
ncbi:MAG: hypothetical protein ACKVQA_03920 [Burkholderiales bacterium]